MFVHNCSGLVDGGKLLISIVSLMQWTVVYALIVIVLQTRNVFNCS